MEFRIGISLIYLGAFRKTQQVIRLLTVSFGFQVFVSVAARRHLDPNAIPCHANEEAPFAALDALDGRFLGYLPRLSVVEPADVFDAFVRVVPVSFIDAFYLICIRHVCFLIQADSGLSA